MYMVLKSTKKKLSKNSYSVNLVHTFVVLLVLSFSIFIFYRFDIEFIITSKTSSTIQSAKQSIWKIEIPPISGTGFFVGPRLFVTNLHIISSMLQDHNMTDITLSQKENPVVLKIKKVLSLSALHDLTFIETEYSVNHYLTLRNNVLNAKETLFVLGYPEGDFKQMKKIGNIFFSEYNFYYFAINHSFFPGISGSPVLDKTGNVVGVVSRAAENILFSLALDYLKKFITGATGLNCSTFISVKKCIKEEIKNLQELAKQGSSVAQYHLGMMYFYGKGGVEKNLQKAIQWTTRAAKQGNAPAQHNLAYMYYHEKKIRRNLQKAFEWWTKAAEQDYLLAQYYLGDMYFKGERVNKDPQKASQLWTRAAEQGLATAQYNLILMYTKGEGVEKDLNMARYWYQKYKESL